VPTHCQREELRERRGPKILISGASLAHHLWAKSMDGIRKGDTHKRRKILKQQARHYNSSIIPQTTKIIKHAWAG